MPVSSAQIARLLAQARFPAADCPLGPQLPPPQAPNAAAVGFQAVLLDRLLLIAAILAAKDSKTNSGETKKLVVGESAPLAKNDTDGPMFVHVRANLPASPTQARLYLGPTSGAVGNESAAPFSLIDEQQDTFLLYPSDALWGRLAGPSAGTAAQIPVVKVPVLATYQHLMRLRLEDVPR